jgi:hypothetical protein
MKKVTKVICRFLASEYDEDGNMIYELPVAAGKEEFHACIFYPFGTKLDEYVAKMNEELNAKETAQDVQKGSPRQRVRGYERSQAESKGGRKKDRSQAEDQRAGGPQERQPTGQGPEEPEGDVYEGQPEEATDGG